MNYKFLLVLIPLFISKLLFSQEVSMSANVIKAHTIEQNGIMKFNNIFDLDSTGVYMLKSSRLSKANIILEHLDDDLCKNKSREIKFKEAIKPDNLLIFNDNLYFFYTKKVNINEETYLYCQSVNKETLNLNNDEIVITNGLSKYKEFNYKLSPDKTKLLIRHKLIESPYYREDTISGMVDSSEMSRLELLVFKENMIPYWELDENLKSDNKFCKLLQIEINDIGNIFILGETIEKSIKEKKQISEELLFSYTDKGQLVLISRLSISNYFLTGLKAIYGNDNTIQIYGLYSELAKGNSKGYFSMTYDVMLDKFTDKHIRQLDNDLILHGLTDK